jgi:hypothetical protein
MAVGAIAAQVIKEVVKKTAEVLAEGAKEGLKNVSDNANQRGNLWAGRNQSNNMRLAAKENSLKNFYGGKSSAPAAPKSEAPDASSKSTSSLTMRRGP